MRLTHRVGLATPDIWQAMQTSIGRYHESI